MMRIAICDDEQVFCHDLEIKILGISKNVDIDVYYTLEDLKQKLDAQVSYDLLFLDIEFASSDGISAGKYIREILDDDQMQIVFVSSNQSYAMELFDINPSNFLIKPLTVEVISKEINKAAKKLDRGNAVFKFYRNNVSTQVKQKDVMYFISSERKVHVNMKNENFWIYEKIDNLEQQAGERFLRIHQSYLVNYDHVVSFYKDSVKLSDGMVLAISKSRSKDTEKFIHQMSLR